MPASRCSGKSFGMPHIHEASSTPRPVAQWSGFSSPCPHGLNGPGIEHHEDQRGEADAPSRRDHSLSQAAQPVDDQHQRRARRGRRPPQKPHVTQNERRGAGEAGPGREAQQPQTERDPPRNEPHVEPGDGKEVGQPGFRVALADSRVHLTPPTNHQRVDQGRARPEQLGAPPGHALAQRAATARHRVEQPPPPDHEDAPLRGADPPSRHHPRRPAARGPSIRPLEPQQPAARPSRHTALDHATLGRDRIRGADKMRRALDRRRTGAHRVFQRAVGLEAKVAQYGLGERFVSHAMDRAGPEGFAKVWQRPEHLPTLDEVYRPDRWVDRVAAP